MVMGDQLDHDAAPRLVLFSGPPGVGKSTLSYALARHTGWAVIAKDGLDRTFESLDASAWSPLTAYHLMFGITDLNLGIGTSIILDAVFGKEDFRRQAAALADRHHARFRAIVCRCGNQALWQSRIEGRPYMVAGWTPADWDEARRSAANYEPWSGPHLVLDAVDPLEHNLDRLLQYVAE